MSTAENPLDPLVLGDIEIRPLGRIGVITQDGNDGVGLVKNDQSPVQIGNRDIVSLNRGRGGHPQTRRDFIDEVAVANGSTIMAFALPRN